MNPQIPKAHGQLPIIGRQGPSREQQMQAALMQAVNRLSMSIYQNLAVSKITTLDTHEAVGPETFGQLARDAHQAAKAYFEGLGIVKFDQGLGAIQNKRCGIRAIDGRSVYLLKNAVMLKNKDGEVIWKPP